jgi:hypothetical protein
MIAASIAGLPLFPQNPQSAAPQPDDPPSRVARLNWLSGDVSFQPAGLEEWTGATVNYPLTTSDHLFTGEDSRAELHIGPNAIRLDANTNFGFLNLDDSIVQVSITEGSVEIHLLSLEDSDAFEIATPNGAITLLRTGEYRIDTDPGLDATMLTVRAGQAELFSGSASVLIRAQQTAYFKTDQSPNVQTANPPDDFDAFVGAREGTIATGDAAASAAPNTPRGIDRFPDRVSVADLVADGVTGAEDLNAYGVWQNNGPYGQEWIPPVDPSWAPYSDGDWAYVEPWGWTWIDAAPWGFAPFHYGRWAYASNRWVWIPGPRNTVHIYAPALVTFIGGGAADGIGWFPLGPRDIWTPPWRAAPADTIVSRASVSMNRASFGAVHTMSQSDFVAGARVRPALGLAVEGQILGSSPLVMPVRESVLPGPVRSRPAIVNRALIARTAPPAAPISFAAKLGVLAQNQGRPLAPKQLADLRRQLPAATMQRTAVRYTAPLVNSPRSDRPTAKSDRPTRPAAASGARTNQ